MPLSENPFPWQDQGLHNFCRYFSFCLLNNASVKGNSNQLSLLVSMKTFLHSYRNNFLLSAKAKLKEKHRKLFLAMKNTKQWMIKSKCVQVDIIFYIKFYWRNMFGIFHCCPYQSMIDDPQRRTPWSCRNWVWGAKQLFPTPLGQQPQYTWSALVFFLSKGNIQLKPELPAVSDFQQARKGL